MPRPREESQAQNAVRGRELRALYGELVADHATEIWRYAYRLSGERSDADDLTQETFLEAWRSLAGLTTPSAGRAWLLRILSRRATRLWTQRKRHPQSVGNSTDLGDALQGASALRGASALPPGRLDLLSEERTLRRALGALSPERRSAFLLVFQHGMTCQETADLLDIPRGTVLSRIHRARQELRAGLCHLGEEHLGENRRPFEAGR